MSGNKKEYETPKFEKLDFTFSDTMIASTTPGQPTLLDEDGNPVIDTEHYVYTAGSCTIYRMDDNCF